MQHWQQKQQYCLKEDTITNFHVTMQKRTNILLTRRQIGSTNNINSAVLTVVDLIVTNYGVAARANLDASQCIAVDVVEFDKSSAFAEYINTALMPVEDLIFSENDTNNNDAHSETTADRFRTNK